MNNSKFYSSFYSSNQYTSFSDSTTIGTTSSSGTNVTFSSSSLADSETRVSFSPNRSLIEKQKSNTSTSIRSTISATGTIRCDAGPPEDRATVTYTVTRDGRNYEMRTNDGNKLHLEFNKKHAYLLID